jgi:hypothetical protein
MWGSGCELHLYLTSASDWIESPTSRSARFSTVEGPPVFWIGHWKDPRPVLDVFRNKSSYLVRRFETRTCKISSPKFIEWLRVSWISTEWKAYCTWERNWSYNLIAIFLTDLDLFCTVGVIMLLLMSCGFRINWRKGGHAILTAINSITFMRVPWKFVTLEVKNAWIYSAYHLTEHTVYSLVQRRNPILHFYITDWNILVERNFYRTTFIGKAYLWVTSSRVHSSILFSNKSPYTRIYV